MNLDEKIQLKVLQLKASANHGMLLEHLIEHGGDEIPLRQMCAKVSPALHDRLEQMTSMLNMSKREFIEAAVIDALDRADDVLERTGTLRQLNLIDQEPPTC